MAMQVKEGNQIRTNKAVAGRATDWRSMSLQIADDTTIIMSGVTALMYGETEETQNNYGIGGTVVSKGFGNSVIEGTITMSVYQLETILDSVDFDSDEVKRPQNIKAFNLVVKYSREDGTESVDTLYGCTFDSYKKELNQNDMDVQVLMNLNPVGIEWNRII